MRSGARKTSIPIARVGWSVGSIRSGGRIVIGSRGERAMRVVPGRELREGCCRIEEKLTSEVGDQNHPDHGLVGGCDGRRWEEGKVGTSQEEGLCGRRCHG